SQGVVDVGEICRNPPSPPIVAPLDHPFLERGGESRLRNPLHGNLHGGICEGREHRQAYRGFLLLGNPGCAIRVLAWELINMAHFTSVTRYLHPSALSLPINQ